MSACDFLGTPDSELKTDIQQSRSSFGVLLLIAMTVPRKVDVATQLRGVSHHVLETRDHLAVVQHATA